MPALLAPPKQQVFVSAGTAFKIGFFGFWGAAVASIVVWILAFIVLGACGAVIVGALIGPAIRVASASSYVLPNSAAVKFLLRPDLLSARGPAS